MNNIKSKKVFIKQIRVPLLKQLQKIDKSKLNEITFMFADGTKKIQTVRKEFIMNSNNTFKTSKQLENDLLSISHDMGAKYILL